MPNKPTSKNKEIVRLRKRALANGGFSLYLDMYYDGKRTYESLKLCLPKLSFMTNIRLVFYDKLYIKYQPS